MDTHALTTELLDWLRQQGAALAGVADLSVVPAEARGGLPRGIAFAMALQPEIVAQLADGPTTAYAAEYEWLNDELSALGARCAAWLHERGFAAQAQSATVGALDRATLSEPLPHKTVATRAGLGWIGRCALLITPEYGPAVRLCSVLTDAPLVLAEPIAVSRCADDCTACRDTCPGQAPTGAAWRAGLPRAELYDACACARAARSLAQAQGIPHILCARCVAACPWTRRAYAL